MWQTPSLHGVVVGDGHQIHGPLFCDGADLFRFGKAFRASKLLEHPLRRAPGKPGMDVEIDSGRRKGYRFYKESFDRIMGEMRRKDGAGNGKAGGKTGRFLGGASAAQKNFVLLIRKER
jgi:hypothetical protein